MEIPNEVKEKVVTPPTQSQRFRAVLYRLWEVEKLPNEPFEKYYQEHMEKLIEWVRKKLSN